MNSEKLIQAMDNKQINVHDMYTALGISRSAFYRKSRGIVEFKLSEIQKICEILDLDTASDIFFDSKVS